GGNATTRGWFRIDPGQCRTVAEGAVSAEHIYVHVRALPVYGSAPLPQAGHADLCISSADFNNTGARVCRTGVPRTARITEIKPSETEKGLSATLAEEAEYDDEQARLAAIQRLLTMSGYDATPVDGVTGPKTEAAIKQFIADRKLPADAANAATF